MPSMTCAHVGKPPMLRWCALWTEERGEAGRQGASELYPLSRSRHACSRPSSAHRAFLTVRESVAQDRYGSLLALSDSHASLTLRQSATLRGRAPTGRTHRPPTRRLSVSARARSRAAQTPGGMKLAAREGKAPVWGCRASRLLQRRGAYEVSRRETAATRVQGTG